MFFHRLRYHMTKHLVKRNAIFEGVALQAQADERLIVLSSSCRRCSQQSSVRAPLFSPPWSRHSPRTLIVTSLSSMHLELLVLSLLTTRHSMTAYTKIKQQLLLHLPLKRHIDLVHVEFPMEELATVSKDASQGEGSNQVKIVLVRKTKFQLYL